VTNDNRFKITKIQKAIDFNGKRISNNKAITIIKSLSGLSIIPTFNFFPARSTSARALI